MTDIIAQTLDCEPLPKQEVVVHQDSADDFEEKVKQFRANAAKNAAADFQDSRQNIKDLIASGMRMIPDVMQAVSETQDAKSIHAASDFLNTLAQMNGMLVKMHAENMRNAGKTTKTEQPKIEQNIGTNQMVVVADPTSIFKQLEQDSKVL